MWGGAGHRPNGIGARVPCKRDRSRPFAGSELAEMKRYRKANSDMHCCMAVSVDPETEPVSMCGIKLSYKPNGGPRWIAAWHDVPYWVDKVTCERCRAAVTVRSMEQSQCS